MKAIEQGIITESTKARLQDLEAKRHTLEEKILLAEYSERQKITKQEIYDYLKTTLKKEPRFLLNLLVNKIFVYKDKMKFSLILQIGLRLLRRYPPKIRPIHYIVFLFLPSVRIYQISVHHQDTRKRSVQNSAACVFFYAK